MAFPSGCIYAYSPATFHVPDGLQVAELPGLEPDLNSCRSPSPIIEDEAQLLDSDYYNGLNRDCFYARAVYRTWRSWKFPASSHAMVWDRSKCPMKSCDARFQDLDSLLIHLEKECKSLQSQADLCHSTWCRAKSLFKSNKTFGLRRINSLHESLKKRRKTSLPEATTDHLGGFPSRASSTTSSVPPPYSKSELATGASSLDDVYPLDSRGFVHELQAPWFMEPVEVQAVERASELDNLPGRVELPASVPTYHNHSSQVNCDARDTLFKSLTSISDMTETTASSRGRDSLLSVYSRPTASSWSTTMSPPPICTTATPVDSQGPIFTDVLTMSPVDTDNGESMETSSDFDSPLYGRLGASPRSAAVSPITDDGHKGVISSEPLSGGSGPDTTPIPLSSLDANNRHISSEQQMAANSGAANKTMPLFHIDINNRDTPSELLDDSNPGETQHVPSSPRVATTQSSLVSKDNGNFSRPVLSTNSQWTTGTAAGTRRVAPGLTYKYIPTSTASDTFKPFAQASLIQQSPTVRKTSHPSPIQPSFTAPTMSASNFTSATLPIFISSMTFPQVTGSSSAIANNTFVDKLESLKVRLSDFRKALPIHGPHGTGYAEETMTMPEMKDEHVLLAGLDYLEMWLKNTPKDEHTCTTSYKFCFAYLVMAMVDDIRGRVPESFVHGLRADFAGFVENEGVSGLNWRFSNAASAYLRVLNHHVPTSHAGRDEVAGSGQEVRRRFEVFETMTNYLRRHPCPRRPSEPAAAITTQSPGPRLAAAAQAPQPAPTANQTQRKRRRPSGEPVAAAANLPGPRPAAPASSPAQAPQPAATANPVQRKRRRRSDKPVETCCKPCEYFPDPGQAQQKKLARHWITPKHLNRLKSLGLATAASTPAAAGTPSSAGSTTPGSFVPDVPKYHCTLRRPDGTPCRVTCSRRDNLKNHMKKQPHLVEPESEEEEEEQQQDLAFNGNVNGRLDFGIYGNDYEDDEDDDWYGPTHVKRAKYSQEEEEDEGDFADENERPYGGRRLYYDSQGHPTTGSYTAGAYNAGSYTAASYNAGSYTGLFSGF
ncbi:hypothetical protein V8F33_012358 [Rhypophila sp. PSN 637]